MEIVFKTKDFLIVNKPALVPSQPDVSNDKDAMTIASEMLKALGEDSSLWLVHRLDRVVGGLLVFARRKSAAAELSSLIAEGKLNKTYLAITEGNASGGELSDFLYKDSLTGKAYVAKTERKGTKLARLEYRSLASHNEKTLVAIRLETGRFHQIRVQFSSRKMPLVGDKKYGSRDLKSKHPALFAYKLEFTYHGKDYSFKALPDIEDYPWNLFEINNYEDI